MQEIPFYSEWWSPVSRLDSECHPNSNSHILGNTKTWWLSLSFNGTQVCLAAGHSQDQATPWASPTQDPGAGDHASGSSLTSYHMLRESNRLGLLACRECSQTLIEILSKNYLRRRQYEAHFVPPEPSFSQSYSTKSLIFKKHIKTTIPKNTIWKTLPYIESTVSISLSSVHRM